MGSKPKAGADVAVADVYRPPPTSVSLFDIGAVEEPWLIAKNKKDGDEETEEDDEESTDDDEDDEKKPIVNTTVALLDKLEGYELAPASWSEVSKALEDMKPALEHTKPSSVPKKKKKKQEKPAAAAAEPAPSVEGAAADIKEEEIKEKAPPPELAGRRVVKDNPFLTRDRENKDGAAPKWRRRDPFEGCPERRPPGASGGGVVLYTTTLRGVRRTFEDCERARELVEACAEAAGVPAIDERDVSLHGAYLRELRELAALGGEAAPPRLFVMGRYVGGAEECARLAESGKLREMMRWAKARGEACAAKDGRGCMGCGGARFVPCWECGGSCKVVVGDGVERCGKCNENGLIMCPICH
jgi:glutaredoxin domain-containing cysteine-rich protein 1